MSEANEYWDGMTATRGIDMSDKHGWDTPLEKELARQRDELQALLAEARTMLQLILDDGYAQPTTDELKEFLAKTAPGVDSPQDDAAGEPQ